MVRVEHRDSDWLGIAASAVGGLLAGLMAGMVLGEFLGDLHPDRVRGALRRIRGSDDAPEDPRVLQRALESALEDDSSTAVLDVRAEALGDAIVELTGTVASRDEAESARDVVQEVPGVDVVVNHILVEGDDVPARDASAR